MSVEKRPYAGTFKANTKARVRYTPDALVFLNGDTALNSTTFARRKIDIQPFVTQVSCDHGTQPGTASASVTLSIPRKLGSEIFREGNTMLTTGLEVHIYLRGYHPVLGVQAVDSASPDYEDIMKTIPNNELDPDQTRIDDGTFAVRPYYHAFHGVVTQVSHEYSGGFYSAGLECTGMLHFWQYMDMSTNASLFGPKPTGSGLKMSLVGHNYTNKTPFSIIYSLYRNTAGAAGAVAFALSSSGNIQNPSPQGDVSLFTQTQRYWQRRFSQGMYRLRMYGVDGEMFNTATQAMIGTMTSAQLSAAASEDLYEYRAVPDSSRDPFRFFDGQMNRQTRKRLIDQDIREMVGGRRMGDVVVESSNLMYQRIASENSSIGIAVQQLKAYVTDISAYGSVNLFQSSYESKLDLAIAAANACGYEFYQDVDGDLVFKPPLYNMDTSGLTGYTINPVDVISISYAENEPEATFMTVKSEAFQNTNGMSLSEEWGVRGQFIDYQLVAKYGWRPGDFQASFYSSGRAAFWAAVARMALINKSMNTASLTIPLRPELRCGHPVYIKHIDTYYYIDSMSHQFSYGGACQTTLQLVARRRKFYPPGRVENQKTGIDAVRLDRPDYEPIPVTKYDELNRTLTTTGFPNVVMALDPSNINPLAYLLGTSALDITNKYQINSVLITLFNSGMIELDAGPEIDLSQPSTWGTIRFKYGATEAFIKGTRTKYPIAWSNKNPTGGYVSTSSPVDDSIATANVSDFYTQAGLLEDRVSKLDARLRRFYTNQTSHSGSATDQRWKDLQKAVAEHEEQLMKEWTKNTGRRSSHGHLANSVGDLTILDLKRIAVGEMGKPKKPSAGGTKDPTNLSSAEILNILGDRKASFSNHETPGFYRYYSTSHPDTAHHAPLAYKYQPYDPNDSSSQILPSEDPSKDTFVGPTWKKRTVFKESLDGIDLSHLSSNDEQLNRLKSKMLVPENPDSMTGKDCRGFRLVSGGRASTEVMPSHRIHRLEFASSPLAWNHLVPNGTRYYPELNAGNSRQGFRDLMMQIFLGARPTDNLNELLKPLLEQLHEIILPSVEPYPGDTTAKIKKGKRQDGDKYFFGRRFTDPLQTIYARTKTYPRLLNKRGGPSRNGWADVTTDGVFEGSIPEIAPWGMELFMDAGSIPDSGWVGSQSVALNHRDPMNPKITIQHFGMSTTHGHASLLMDRVFVPSIDVKGRLEVDSSGPVEEGIRYSFDATETFDEAFERSIKGGKANWVTDEYPWLKHAFEAHGAIGQVPLNCLPLVCKAFLGCYPAKPSRVPGKVGATGGYRPDKANMTKIYNKLAELMSDDFYRRCWTIAGQYRNVFEEYIPKPKGGVDPRASSMARIAYGKYLQFWENVNAVANTSWAQKTANNRAYYVQSSGTSKTTYIKSPIFPVSDAKGYEHYGCYAYGRGLDPEDGDFQGLMDQDPVQLLSNMEVDGVPLIDAIEQAAAAMVDTSVNREARLYALGKISKAVMASGDESSIRQFLSHDDVKVSKTNDMRKDVNWQKFKSLDAQAPAGGGSPQSGLVKIRDGEGTAKSEIELDAREQIIMLGLLNAFASPTSNQSAQNTAYSLADLTPLNQTGDESSSAYFVASDSVLSDSFVEMDAYDAGNFVYVSSGGSGEATHWSPLVDHAANLMVEKSIDWALHQQALRGRTEVPYQVPELGNLYDKFVEPYANLGDGDYWADLASPIYEEGNDDTLWAQVETLYGAGKENLENSAIGGGAGAALGALALGLTTGGAGILAGAVVGGIIGGGIQQEATDDEGEEG